jgi:outer membrane protein TolC
MKKARNSNLEAFSNPPRFLSFLHFPIRISDLFRISDFGFRILLPVFASTWCFSCIKNFGTGGTGEMVVSRDRLRKIDPIDLTTFAQPGSAGTQPSTEPSTQPVLSRAASTQPDRPPVQVQITLTDVRRLALENNLDLKVELLNPSISKTALTEAEAQYEALFTLDSNFTTTDSAIASELVGSQSKDFSTVPGLEIPLRTGGTLRLTAPFDRFETNNSFTFLNPAYTANPSVQITQPLLRGAGFDVNAQRIRVAFYDYQQAQARTKLEVIRVLADAERVYWRLYAAREELKLRQAQYDLAVAQLERARRQAKAGVVPEVDVIRAESGVADQVEAIITSENSVRDRQRELKRTLNSPGLDMGTPTILVPATEPAAVVYRLDAEALVKSALGQRMEMLEEELQIAEENANLRVARNGLLPLVTLAYTYNVNGLGPAFDDALTQVREKRFEGHQVGVHVEVPIGNGAAESQVRRSVYNRLQDLATKEQRTLQIRQEVYNAVDQLEANWQRLLASRQRVIVAARVVELETRQFNLGLRTSTDVLDAQTRLADARSSEIAAVTEYQIAQVDIAFATGTVLGESHVAWQPTVASESEMRR